MVGWTLTQKKIHPTGENIDVTRSCVIATDDKIVRRHRIASIRVDIINFTPILNKC